jgi:hypothetical protein
MDEKLVQRVRRSVYSTKPPPPVAGHLLTNGLLDLGYLALMRAALLELGKRAVLGGRSAALAWGWDLLVEPDRVTADVRAWLPPPVEEQPRHLVLGARRGRDRAQFRDESR